MRIFPAIVLAMTLPVAALLSGCEWDHRDREVDFANAAPTAMDVYRNGALQFTLPPGADGSCHLDRNDLFAVVDHATGQVRGTHTVEFSGEVSDIRVTAVIYSDHVDWSTDVDTG